MKLIDYVMVIYIVKKWEELQILMTQKALVVLDAFKGKVTKSTLKRLMPCILNLSQFPITRFIFPNLLT